MTRLAGYPDVSVVIPSRDRPALVAEAVRIALAQSGVAPEVLVVDDASEPPLQVGVAEVVRVDYSGGLAHARNAGACRSRAKWVAFLDDDDSWAPDKLARQLERLDATGARFAYCSALYVDERGQFLKAMPAPPSGGLSDALRHHNVIPAGSSNVVVERELFTDLGGFDEELSHVADWDLWLRLAESATACACPETLVAYTEHPDALHVTRTDELAREFEVLSSKIRARGLEPPDRRAFLHFVASGHRRGGRRRQALSVYAKTLRGRAHPGDVARALTVMLGERSTARLRRLLAPREQREVPGWVRRYDDAPPVSSS